MIVLNKYLYFVISYLQIKLKGCNPFCMLPVIWSSGRTVDCGTKPEEERSKRMRKILNFYINSKGDPADIRNI